jgi:site-specific DNA-adenine methylase
MPEIKVISICALNLSDNFEQSCQQLKDFCHENNAYYYAQPREDFSLQDAVEIAKSFGNTTVVVEDLS